MLLQIVLTKGAREASNAWPSLLEGQYPATAQELDEMQKKLTLERFQREVRPAWGRGWMAWGGAVKRAHGAARSAYRLAWNPFLHFFAVTLMILVPSFLRQNPGMDFSGADITGNYQNGGPSMPA